MEKSRNVYKFYSRDKNNMETLIDEGRVPMNAGHVIDKRLYSKNHSLPEQSRWMNNYFHTIDGFAYNCNGDLKIVLDSQLLKDVTLKTKRVNDDPNGALILTQQDYDNLNGEEFDIKNLIKMGIEYMLKEEVKNNPVWKIVARGQSRLNKYIDYIFDLMETMRDDTFYKRDVLPPRGMSIDLDNTVKEDPILCPLVMSQIGWGCPIDSNLKLPPNLVGIRSDSKFSKLHVSY